MSAKKPGFRKLKENPDNTEKLILGISKERAIPLFYTGLIALITRPDRDYTFI